MTLLHHTPATTMADAAASPTQPTSSPGTPMATAPDAVGTEHAYRFAPVSLQELNAEAENLTRQDRKYVVSMPALTALLADLPAGTKILEIDGAQHFPYSSTYFDTLSLESFLQAAHKRRRKWKVRTRRYSNGAEFLEVKTIGERGVTAKERIPFDGDLPFSPESSAFIRNTFAANRVEGVRPDDLWPSLRTTYTRTTFLPPDGDARVTVDTDLAFRPLHIDAASRERRAHQPVRGLVELGPLAIVETKAHHATSADRALWRRGYRPARLSKYAAGIILTCDAERGGRWYRTLTHHIPNAIAA